jgi:DHA1 family bicyclomycin/chloramphenicol resistance-like MFS transporter
LLRPGTFALTALLATMTGIGPLSTDMYLPSLPDIARLLGASPAQVQLTISTYLIGFAVGQIFYGPISDRHGRKPVLLAAIAIYCLATLVCMLATSIEVLMIFRGMQAFGGCGAIVLARAIVRDLYSGVQAGRELSTIASVMALAPVIAPLIGGVLQMLFGWRANFAALLGIGLLLAATAWLRLPETLSTRSAEPVSPASILRSFRIIASNRAYLAYLGLAAFSFAGLFAWISGASFVLQDLYGLSALSFGVAFACGSVGYMAGSALAARLVVRIGLNNTIGIGVCGLALGGLGMVAAVASGLMSAASLVIPMAVYLAGMGMVLGQAERAGAASSLLGVGQQGSAAICGAIVGYFLTSAWAMALGVAVMGCAALLLWLMTRELRARAVSAG